MNTLLEIIKYIIPSIVMFGAVYFILNRFFEQESRKQLLELKQQQRKDQFPLKIQAYERGILLLERISPYSIIPRTYKNGMSARLLQTELLQGIRNEFEHNLTIQLQLSAGGWELIKNAKEETIKLINIAGTRVNDTSSGADLAKTIYDLLLNIEKAPSQIAIDYLKKEYNSKFGE